MAMAAPTDWDDDVRTCIGLNRHNLVVFYEAFQASIALFDLLEWAGQAPGATALPLDFIRYRRIAARDAALNLYHFKYSLRAIKKNLPKSVALSARIDAVAIRNALKYFNSNFPNIDQVRHAVAHAGELFSNVAKMRQNESNSTITGHGFTHQGRWFSEAMSGRIYTVGIEGKAFFVVADQSTLLKLGSIISMVDLAFQDALAPIEQS
jgi:hypothetical protein